MNHRQKTLRRRALAPLLLLLLGGSFLSGCATVPPAPPERMAGADDPLQPLPWELVGVVVFVDAEEQLAVIRTRSAGTRVAPSMVARNEALVETARLEPTRFHRGRTVGARIVSGLPNVGDEVTAAR